MLDIDRYFAGVKKDLNALYVQSLELALSSPLQSQRKVLQEEVSIAFTLCDPNMTKAVGK